MTDEEANKILDEAVAKLGEHFEAVQILVSWVDGGTSCTKRGSGNWYARIGMCHEMIESDKSQDTAHQIADQLKPQGDDGEEWKG